MKNNIVERIEQIDKYFDSLFDDFYTKDEKLRRREKMTDDMLSAYDYESESERWQLEKVLEKIKRERERNFIDLLMDMDAVYSRFFKGVEIEDLDGDKGYSLLYFIHNDKTIIVEYRFYGFPEDSDFSIEYLIVDKVLDMSKYAGYNLLWIEEDLEEKGIKTEKLSYVY